jgi:hypothetical protein
MLPPSPAPDIPRVGDRQIPTLSEGVCFSPSRVGSFASAAPERHSQFASGFSL